MCVLCIDISFRNVCIFIDRILNLIGSLVTSSYKIELTIFQIGQSVLRKTDLKRKTYVRVVIIQATFIVQIEYCRKQGCKALFKQF